MRAQVEPTSAADVAEFLPEGLTWRIRGLTVRADDRIVGIGGIGYLPDGTAFAFIECSEDAARRYPVTLMRAARRTLALADELGIRRLVARVDTERAAAARFLQRLGFRFAGVVDGQTIYVRD